MKIAQKNTFVMNLYLTKFKFLYITINQQKLAKIYNYLMIQQKRGKRKIKKRSSSLSQVESLKKLNTIQLKSVLKQMKKVQKQRGNRSNQCLNQENEIKNPKHLKKQKQGKEDLYLRGSEQLISFSEQDEDQDQNKNQLKIQARVQNQNQNNASQTFKNIDQRFSKLIHQCQSELKNESIQFQSQQLINLHKRKEIYESWVDQLNKNISNYYPKINLNQNDKTKQKKKMTQDKNSKQLKDEINQLKQKQLKLKILLLEKTNQNLLIENNGLKNKTLKLQNLLNEKEEIDIMNNFYDQKLYQKKNTYIEMIRKVSEIIMKAKKNKNNMKENSNDYINRLKLILYKTGCQYLSQSDKKKLVENYRAWIQFKIIILDILQTKRINFLAFQIENEQFDLHFRQMLIDASFVNFREAYKNTKNYNRQLISYQPLSQLSIKKSNIYYQDEINQLEEMVQVLKNSWYLRFNLAFYIQDRQKVFKQIDQKNNNKKNFKPKTPSQILQSVTKFMRNAKVYFIDYAMVSVNGITLTVDPCKQYPIFINLFSFFEGKKISTGFFQSYTLFLLVHELAHSVIRNYDWIQTGESSNPFNFMKDNKKDGGWMFQHLIFGGPVEVYTQKDYENVKDLLKLENRPPFIKSQIPINKRFYQDHHQKIISQYEKLKLQKQRKQKNQRDTDYLIKSQGNHRQERDILQIPAQKKYLNDILLDYSKLKQKHEKSQVKTQIQIQIKKESQNKCNINEQQFEQMEKIISCYGQRKLLSIKSNEKHQFMALKVGNQSQSEIQFRELDLRCGTHYK